jgi:integrase/recombinase XerC
VAAIIAGVPDLDTEISLRNRLMIELAYGSGLRRCEIVGLDIEDIDLAGKTARVTGKGRKVRIVPLTEKSIELLRRYLSLRHASRGPLIISMNTGRRLAIRHVSKLFKRLTGHNTHRFRHACATHLLQNGCNLRYIQQLLGHVKCSTTEIYTAVDRSRLSAIVAANHPRAIIA